MQPGGKIDAGETPAEAVCREVYEELGTAVSHADIRPLGRHRAEAANEPGHHVEADLYSVTLRDEPRPTAEIEEIAWIDPAAPGDIELAPLTRDTVLDLVRRAAQRSG